MTIAIDSNSISVNKGKLYGIAAILVVLYHTYCVAHWMPLIVFSLGYIGVDIFLLVGAFSLCYSIKKNSLSQFYLNRLIRIYPIWFVTYVLWLFSLDYLFKGISLTPLEILWQSTIIGPLLAGESGCDWFTAALFVYYLFFPLLYRLISKMNGLQMTVFYFIVCTIVFTITGFHLYPTKEFNCFVSRIPCFLLGIITYVTKDKHVFSTCAIGSVLLAVLSLVLHQKYLLTAMLVPLLLVFIIDILDKIVSSGKSGKLLEFVGSKSLECYYGGRGWNYFLGGGN